MGMEAKRVALPQIKRDSKLPTVLSQDEVKRLLNAPKYLKHRLIIGMLYGCGLRSYELCGLKLADIDFDRRTVFIPKKKGKIDRYVPLSKYLARGLKKYIRTENPQIYLFNSQVTKDGEARGVDHQWHPLDNQREPKQDRQFQKDYRPHVTPHLCHAFVGIRR